MSLYLHECRKCGFVDTEPWHNCRVTGTKQFSSRVHRYCDICGDRLPAGMVFHDWCGRAHRADLAAGREAVVGDCQVRDDDIAGYVDGAMELAPWQRQILHQLIEKYRNGEPVVLSANARRNGQQTLKRHWARIEKRLDAEAKEKK